MNLRYKHIMLTLSGSEPEPVDNPVDNKAHARQVPANVNMTQDEFDRIHTCNNLGWTHSNGMSTITYLVKTEGFNEVGSLLPITYEMPHEDFLRFDERSKKNPWVKIFGDDSYQWWRAHAYYCIGKKLDEMGYDFLPYRFVAVKRTGFWRNEEITQ